MLTFHHVGVAQCTKALSTKHATHHTTQACVLEHALHVVGGHQTTHQATHHPGHTPGVARHLLGDLKPRVCPRLGFKKPLVCHHRADVHASTPQPARVGTELGCFPVAASVVRYNLFCVV